MTPAGRPKLKPDDRREQDSFMMSPAERRLVEQAIKQGGTKETVRQWIVRKALEAARKILGIP